MAVPDTLRINGPYWSAEALLLSAPVPGEAVERSPLARLLFVDSTPRTAHGVLNALLPGTLLALCHVRSVVIAPDAGFSYQWAHAAGAPPPAVTSATQIEAALAAGTASLLVLRADPAQLAAGGQAVLDCLNGEISLDVLPPVGDAVARLYAAVGLLPPAGPPPAFAQRRQITVHASGVSLYGQVQFPWQDAPLTLPLLAAQKLPLAPPAPPAYRLTIETDRLTALEETLVIRAWRQLSGYLNPKHPLNEFPAAPAVPTPTWLTLELANPTGVPRLFWTLEPWRAAAQLDALDFEPTEVNLLISDQQPYDRANPAASLARVVPQLVRISRSAPNLDITVAAHSDNPAGAGEIVYDWARAPQAEALSLKGLVAAFDAVQTAAFLRAEQGLPLPLWRPDVDNPEPIDRPLLWGFMPLEDGWAELPFLNLTAQMYLDADVGPQNAPDDIAPFMLQGAAAIGNDHEAVLARYRDEQPWNVTLTDAQELRGLWVLQPAAGGYELASAHASFTGPEAYLNGLFWLGTGRPTAEDALPDLTDWVTGLEPIALKTVDPAFDLFPPPLVLRLSDITFALRDGGADGSVRRSALMTAWQFRFELNALVYDALVAQHVLPSAVFDDLPPLLWRRHPALPLIQALPLTQSKAPPTYPGASRQLAPFQVNGAVANWAFRVSGANAAQCWPEFEGDLPPADEWVGENRADLPLVALSLPGLLLDPALDETTAGLGDDLGLELPAQYRFDLPYLDQINALAQAPTPPRSPNEVSPLPDQPPPQPDPPLERTTYESYWERLAERGALASADAVDAFESQGVVAHLVEPYAWPVAPAGDADSYPGALTLTDPETGAARTLSGASALEGLSGNFTRAADGGLRLAPNGAGDDAFAIRSGSMSAHPQDGGLRDQRGLVRQPSAYADGGALLQTPVEFESELNQYERYLLTSALAPLDLEITPALRWGFWFRDLPVLAGSAAFDRLAIQSDEARERDLDINDPEALARRHNYRQGYEWRLGVAGQDEEFLLLGGLRFFPLSLEVVTLSPEQRVERVELIGRLQLPLATPAELTELSSAVRLTFTRAQPAALLTLTAVTMVSQQGEWPLTLTPDAEAADAPLLLWSGIALKARDDGALYLEVRGALLTFFLFDVEWTLPLDEPLEFDLTDAPPAAMALEYGFDYDETAAIYPQKVTASLSLQADYRHQVEFFLNVQAGSRAVDGLAARYTFRQGADPARVYDVAGGAQALHLAIAAPPGAAAWMDGGLTISAPSVLSFAGNAAALAAELRAAREFSAEVWLTPLPGGPASSTVIALDQGRQPGFRLAQNAGRVEARLGSGALLSAPLPVPADPAQPDPLHIVYARDVWGVARLFIDGALAAEAPDAIDLTTWDAALQIALAAEISGAQPWLGTFHQLSLLTRALSAGEVGYRYAGGAQSLARRSAFRTAIEFSLLDASGNAVPRDQLQAQVLDAQLFDDIALAVALALIDGRSLQFQWQGFPRQPGDAALYLLPGVALDAASPAPGFAALTYEADDGFILDAALAADLANAAPSVRLLQAFAAAGFALSTNAVISADGADAWSIASGRGGRQPYSVRRLARLGGPVYRVYAGVPALRLTSGFVESLLTCAWGESLQDPRPQAGAARAPGRSSAAPAQAFGSSAGDLLFNYTARLAKTGAWDETILLNGFVEITNLISWPQAMTFSGGQLTLPATRRAEHFDHLRHTLRLLLNQHEIPASLVVAGEGPLIFQFAGRKAWQFLAVVEHQLIDTHASYTGRGRSAGWEVKYDRDRRWTALQEVRWISPRAFKGFLDAVETVEVVNPFDSTVEATLAIGGGGDDVNEIGSSYEAARPQVWFGTTTESSSNSRTGLRFNGVQIPPGATIVSARLRIVSAPLDGPGPRYHWTMMNLEIAAEAADSSAPFSNSASPQTGRPSLRRLTAARVIHSSNERWDFDQTYDMPDELAPLLQEVVNRPGWRSGGSLALIMRGRGGGRKFVYSQEGGAAKGVRLLVTYRMPARNPYTYGYFNAGFRDLLNAGPQPALQSVPPDVLLVEASAPHYIRRAPAQPANSTSLQYLPFGAQAAALNRPDDFKAARVDAPADGNDWLLLALPFLGRLQPQERDALAFDGAAYAFRLDPVVELQQSALASGPAPSPLALALASRGGETDAALSLVDFDTHVGRLYPRLDPLTVEENWFRLQNPLAEAPPAGLRGVSAALPPTPGRLSRSLALRRAADSFRPGYPPVQPAGLPPDEPLGDGLVWRQHSLMVVQGSAAPDAGAPYGWHFIGLQIRGGLPGTPGAAREADPRALERQRSAAATLLPTPARLGGAANRAPVSFAISPYLNLELLYVDPAATYFQDAAQAGVKVGELLCLSAEAQGLLPVASYIWEHQRVVEPVTNAVTWFDMNWAAWAQATQQQFAAESPLAVLRFREILRAGTGAEASASVRFSYQLVTDLPQRPRLQQRTHRVRSAVRELRFRQGQHGGYHLPAPLHGFEIAPPQTIGVQPVYLTDSLLPDEPWPWGVSGLRVSVQYTHERRAVLDAAPTPDGETTLWWQAPALAVQFRSGEQTERRAASLPRLFRAPAIRSLLPVLPNPPMPRVTDEQLGAVENIDDAHLDYGKTGWQSVLPGLVRYLLTGSRAGAMFVLRNMLIRQRGLRRGAAEKGQSTVSGSVPAQHRYPRPVPLPPNHPQRLAQALQTWASHFDPQHNALVTTAPADEVFFAVCGGQPARRLRLILRAPAHGGLTRGWNNEVVFDVATEQPVPRLEGWTLHAAVADASLRFDLAANPPLVPLLTLEGQPPVEGQSVGAALRERLEAEGIVPPGGAAVFIADESWEVRLGTETFTVYAEDDALAVYSHQPPRGLVAPIPPAQTNELRVALTLGDWARLAQHLDRTVADGEVRRNWLVMSAPGGALYARVTALEGGLFRADSLRLRFSFSREAREKLQGSLVLSISARHHTTTPGFDLTMNFALRTLDERRLPLPFAPYFVHFEDPEYNRLLASNTAHAAAIVKDRVVVDARAEEVAHTVTLAADRREYNADSEIALRFDWDDDRVVGGKPGIPPTPMNDIAFATLHIGRVEPRSGAETWFNLDSGATLNAGELRRYNLAKLAQAAGIRFEPGDNVALRIEVKGYIENPQPGEQITPVPIVLLLPISADAVTPAPQAGYALLRASRLADSGRAWVECARFAWTPDATRVEMVCAEDLRAEVVRRRAVFQWRDSARPGREARHAVQKITVSGATHFPWT